ncbi:MAG: hypothetical protein WCO56_05320 [Verrucomicrobiota bacterium]
MKTIPAIVLAWMLLGIQAAEVCANDYYKNPQARKVADAILDAYGGVGNILKTTRLKTVISLVRGTNQAQMVCYQTKDKLRLDSDPPATPSQIWDGTQAVLVENGVAKPAPEAVKTQLVRLQTEGVGQQDLVRRFLNERNWLKYQGLAAYDHRPHYLFESHNAQGAVVRHYFDQQTALERVEVTLGKAGVESREFVAHTRFKDVLYPSRIVLRDSQARVTGQMEILKLSDDFDDSVFTPGTGK